MSEINWDLGYKPRSAAYKAQDKYRAKNRDYFRAKSRDYYNAHKQEISKKRKEIRIKIKQLLVAAEKSSPQVAPDILDSIGL